MPAPKNPDGAGMETADFIVAPGRTVTIGEGPTAENGYTDTVEHKGPDETVTLSKGEGAKLQRLGFLRADDGSLLVAAEGPKTENGVEIREQE